MGWLIYHPGSFPRTPAEYRQEITRLCTFETENFTAAPVATGVVGTTWYVANRYRPKHPGAAVPTPELFELDQDGGYTVGLVFLTRLPCQSDGWGYKDMDETMGPNEARAPAKVLDALSPIIGSGDRDGCAGLLSIRHGSAALRDDHGTVWRDRRRRVWLALDAGRARCRLSERDLERVGFRVIGHRNVPASLPDEIPS